MKRPSLRTLAERIVAEVLAWAHARGSSAREQRRRMREAFASTVVPRHVRYAAVRAVAGVGLLDLPDARQPALIEKGPRRRKRRKGEVFGDA